MRQVLDTRLDFRQPRIISPNIQETRHRHGGNDLCEGIPIVHGRRQGLKIIPQDAFAHLWGGTDARKLLQRPNKRFWVRAVNTTEGLYTVGIRVGATVMSDCTRLAACLAIPNPIQPPME
jgi:hypothetical protein